MWNSFTVSAVAIALTLVSASMTVLGYTSLYSSATHIIAALFIVLECAKATIFAIVFNVARLHHKMILLILASALIIISFLGHLSYLSKAYRVNQIAISGNIEINESIKESTKAQIDSIDAQIKMLNDEIQAGKDEIIQIRKTVNDLEDAKDRNWMQQRNNRRVNDITANNRQLSAKIQELYKEKSALNKESLQNTNQMVSNSNEIANRSVFKFTADIFGISQDTLANIINVILSLVIDSLALVMLWVAGDLWKMTHKKRKDSKKQEADNNVDSAPVSEAEEFKINYEPKVEEAPVEVSRVTEVEKPKIKRVSTKKQKGVVESERDDNFLKDLVSNETLEEVKVDKVVSNVEPHASGLASTRPIRFATPPAPAKKTTYNKAPPTPDGFILPDRELKKAKNKITPDNVGNFRFNNLKASDIISMDDNNVQKLYDNIHSEDQLNFINSALALRKQNIDNSNAPIGYKPKSK